MTGTSVLPEVFTSLATTRPARAGTAALRAALHARRMLLLKSLLVRVDQQSRLLSLTVRRRFEEDWALLVRAEQADTRAARDVLDYPLTGAWLVETLATPTGATLDRHLAHLGGVALAAAVRAGCGVGGTLPVPSGALALPGLGVLRCPSGAVRISGGAGLVHLGDTQGHSSVVLQSPAARPASGVSRGVGSGPGWSALRTLPGTTVVLDDLDPYRVPPLGIGPRALRATERPDCPRRLWARRWSEAHELLAGIDPERAAETGAVLRAVVPLATAVPRGAAPVGATLRAAPGAALAQLPAQPWELAETLVHETHHTKLAVLDELVPLCRTGGLTTHRVGWRHDPRPVPAVLQGAYAHLALTDLWWRVRNEPAAPPAWRHRADERFEVFRDDVGQALSLLRESDELTSPGREFVHEMGRHHAGLGVATHCGR
ncbi:HEXXH motif-containing putative peptide modification protein [Streptomyces sp. NBC_00663]|uniref:aKG-HExxH-type peptide beta-hydroxylase n=1 Tax=Streptomyces sp. NBC_00663 TaxID=2975801 RepID=UPI002E3819B1|nr:HEXXH motif-containing putative peptide modification protein [Streptomyces sp. NBC_00663]